jgi:hypothetical protein
MARIRTSAKVKLNREGVDEVQLRVAAGMQRFSEAVIENAVVPDAPPYGEGLLTAGVAGVWIEGKLVAGTAKATPPRSQHFRFPPGACAVARFRSRVTHLLEFGTVHMEPRPIIRPAYVRTQPRALELIEEGYRAGLDRTSTPEPDTVVRT